MIANHRTAMEHEQRLTQAAEWVLRLRDPAMPPAEVNDWVAWCDASPDNRRAFAEMQSLWQQTGEIEERSIDPEAIAGDAYRGQVSVDEWRRVSTQRFGTIGRLRIGKSAIAMIAAAAVAALAVLASMWTISHFGSLHDRDVVIATNTGINRDIVLPDGSTVTIAGGSRLATRYSDHEREVLLERGEAFFRVEHDKRRPFVVRALDATVTAIGTAFNVRAEEGVVRVAVTEGAVNVDRQQITPSAAGRSGIGSIRLPAGHQVTLSRIDVDPIVVSVDIEQATSWLSGTLKFVNEPLSSVVAAVNRYSTIVVTIEDPALAEYRYTGTVVADRVDEWLRGLPDIFPVIVRERSGGGVVIDSVAR